LRLLPHPPRSPLFPYTTLFRSDRVVSLGTLVGMITVLGIAARNGILLVQHYRHLERVEAQPFGVELVLRGASERLSPILMTTLRSEEHTSELQSRVDLVCRLLL